MKKIVKCCLAGALGFALVGCSKDGSLVGHKGIQLWKDGPYWAEMNIGAEKPWESGYYFWWGDIVGYKYVNGTFVASDGSTTNFSFKEGNTPTDNKGNDILQREGWITADGVLSPEHDAAHVQWGERWRMPTRQELTDLRSKCDWAWTVTNGVNGYIVRGRDDYSSASIFRPTAGAAFGSSLSGAGNHGFYWSSVPDSDSHNSWFLDFSSGNHYTYDELGRVGGRLIRSVQKGAK